MELSKLSKSVQHCKRQHNINTKTTNSRIFQKTKTIWTVDQVYNWTLDQVDKWTLDQVDNWTFDLVDKWTGRK